MKTMLSGCYKLIPREVATNLLHILQITKIMQAYRVTETGLQACIEDTGLKMQKLLHITLHTQLATGSKRAE